jgi:hypothetical protein
MSSKENDPTTAWKRHLEAINLILFRLGIDQLETDYRTRKR